MNTSLALVYSVSFLKLDLNSNLSEKVRIKGVRVPITTRPALKTHVLNPLLQLYSTVGHRLPFYGCRSVLIQ